MFLVAAIHTASTAHIGDKIYPIFELSDADIEQIDFEDGSITEWKDILGSPTLQSSDFYVDPDIGDAAPPSAEDFDYNFWLGWHQTSSRVYLAMERLDNIYLPMPPTASISDAWKYDSNLGFMVDGDHGGGDYSTEHRDEVFIPGYQIAQHYTATAATTAGTHIALVWETDWVNLPPYSDARGRSTSNEPTVSEIELYVTAFDTLRWFDSDPFNSVVSSLMPDQIIGFNIHVSDFDLSVPDFDREAEDYHAFHILSTAASTWRFADHFVDGHLVHLPTTPTVIKNTTWGRIKASLAP